MASGVPWLVLPTFNEAENIERMLRAADAALAAASPDGHRILVVDDSSPDGTGAIADRVAAQSDGRIAVLHRVHRTGLGDAYLAGFGEALDGGAGFVIEMDCDFSHDPNDLPRLLEAARDRCDLALGSRYVPGGGVTGWAWHRKLISRGGSAYARAVLGLKVRDLTGGFKCFRREVLEGIDLQTVRSHGYAFQVELTNRAIRRGFRVEEIPIVFKDREHGQSKMSAKIAFEAMLLVPRLRGRGLSPAREAPIANRWPPPTWRWSVASARPAKY
jgi:dolichol-phosphate mannosyltransferase